MLQGYGQLVLLLSRQLRLRRLLLSRFKLQWRVLKLLDLRRCRVLQLQQHPLGLCLAVQLGLWLLDKC
jgi:hypothetical protein